MRTPVDKQRSIGQSRIGVRRDLTDDGVRNHGQISSLERRRQEPIHRTRQSARRTPGFNSWYSLSLRRPRKSLHAFAVPRSIFQKNAVRNLRQSVAPPRHAPERLHFVVVRRKILVPDRPILSEAIVLFRAELQIAHAPRRASPHQRFFRPPGEPAPNSTARSDRKYTDSALHPPTGYR
jgi:hypothetical protein